MSSLLSPAAVVEALAYRLFREFNTNEVAEAWPENEAQAYWRKPTSAEIRAEWRRKADDLINRLSWAGLGVKANKQVLDRFIETLITQPATTMYVLEEEVEKQDT